MAKKSRQTKAKEVAQARRERRDMESDEEPRPKDARDEMVEVLINVQISSARSVKGTIINNIIE